MKNRIIWIPVTQGRLFGVGIGQSQSQGVEWVMSETAQWESREYFCFFVFLLHPKRFRACSGLRVANEKSFQLTTISLQFCGSMQHTWMVLLLAGLSVSYISTANLKMVDEWSVIDFNFPSELHRQGAIQRREFISGMAIPIDVDVHYKGWNFTNVR